MEDCQAPTTKKQVMASHDMVKMRAQVRQVVTNGSSSEDATPVSSTSTGAVEVRLPRRVACVLVEEIVGRSSIGADPGEPRCRSSVDATDDTSSNAVTMMPPNTTQHTAITHPGPVYPLKTSLWKPTLYSRPPRKGPRVKPTF